MPNPNVIEFECPRCLHAIRVEGDQAGNRIECPNCQGSLLVPMQSGSQDLFDDIFDSAPMASESQPNTPPISKPENDPLNDNDLTISDAPELTFADRGTLDDSDPSEDAGSEMAAEPASSKSTEADSESDSATQQDSEPLLDFDALDDDDLVAGMDLAGPTDGAKGQPTKLEGKDPFQVDPDAPIKIDGMGSGNSFENTYGVKCKVCDTRIHVQPEQLNTEVECPECFSKVLVTLPDKKPAQRWVKEGRAQNKPTNESKDDELRLSEPVDRPEIDETYGLAPVSDDLLKPKPKTVPGFDDDIPMVTEVDDTNATSDSKQRPTRPKTTQGNSETPRANRNSETQRAKTGTPVQARKKSRREALEESERRAIASESKSAFSAPVDKDYKQDFPNFTVTDLTDAVIDMLRGPGVIWRALVATALLCLGTIVMQFIWPSYVPKTDVIIEKTMFERLVMWFGWGVFGGIPYLLGLATLWFTCGYIFRDAALGKRSVTSWKNSGRSELTGTFLLFAFSFFVAGVPGAFVEVLILPLRFLIGPLLLLSAWFNQSPFAIVSVDAFQRAGAQRAHWMSFYSFMGILSLLGLVSGIAFLLRGVIPFFVLTAFVSVIAVVIMVALTLTFAAVCGWHCGRVVEDLSSAD